MSRSGSGKTTNMKRVLGHLVTTTQPQEGAGVSHSACIVILSCRRRFGARGSLMVESPGGGETVCPAAGGPRLSHGELLQHQDRTGQPSNLPSTNFSPPPHSFPPPPAPLLHQPPVPPQASHASRTVSLLHLHYTDRGALAGAALEMALPDTARILRWGEHRTALH